MTPLDAIIAEMKGMSREEGGIVQKTIMIFVGLAGEYQWKKRKLAEMDIYSNGAIRLEVDTLEAFIGVIRAGEKGKSLLADGLAKNALLICAIFADRNKKFF